jgi:predicted enzyme related to lactoylglutathione lyase
MSDGFTITGIAGVLVWTSPERHAAVAAFYESTLNLPVRSRRPGFVSFAWPSENDVRLTVNVHDGVTGTARDPLRLMVNLAVDDIAAAHARLVRAGVPCLREPERETWGGTVATYSDPDGNTVQLFQIDHSP